MTKKIIVLEGANGEFTEHFAKQVRDMHKDESLVLNNDIKMYNVDKATVITSLNDIIKSRIKIINNEIIKNKRVWRKTNEERSNLIQTAPTYGNEYDYSHEMGYEDKQKLNGLKNKISTVVGHQIDLKDERKYLQQLLKGVIPEFPKRYNW